MIVVSGIATADEKCCLNMYMKVMKKNGGTTRTSLKRS